MNKNGRRKIIMNISNYLQLHHIRNHIHDGITIIPSKNSIQGVEIAKSLLYALVDRKTVLYLSGGNTPKDLYTDLAKEEIIYPACVGMVDERYGKKFHDKSNESMIGQTGLTRYFQMRDIPFYPIIRDNETSRQDCAQLYDQQMRSFNATFQQSVAILGIGQDGHTSGIAPNRGSEFMNPLFGEDQLHLLFSEYDDPKSMYGERVSMTFLGISLLDLIMVLVFGDDKKRALQSLFTSGSEAEIPSRVYKRQDIAQKTLFITDQNI